MLRRRGEKGSRPETAGAPESSKLFLQESSKLFQISALFRQGFHENLDAFAEKAAVFRAIFS
jgi:hypothetical protein